MRADALAEALAAATARRSSARRPARSTPAPATRSRRSPTRPRARGAWLHVDGAFGLWAAASPALRHLVHGAARADSWAVDAHKWLNVPYDGGLAIVADRAALRAAMGVPRATCPARGREPLDTCRRCRAAPARSRSTPRCAAGRDGLADSSSATARWRAASPTALDGVEILNDVVLNQVLLRFDDDDATTRAVVEEVQRGGEAWLGGTVWQGRAAVRVSVSNWSTTEDDIDRLAAALQAARS